MKKLLIIAALALAAACSKKSAPKINAFTADHTDIFDGDVVTLTFDVSGATRITITPDPGVVTASPVTVTPHATTTYTLRAENDAGAISQDIAVTVTTRPAGAKINSFSAVPSQVASGGQVTLTWNVAKAASIKISDGSANPPADVSAVTSKVVTPTATTTYTLTVAGLSGSTPATTTATAIARVVAAAHISFFTASQSSISQGQQITLTWDGTATSWSLSDGTTSTNYGPLKTATVEPAANVTYTLTATGLVGNDTKTLPITVAAAPGVTLVYTAPAVTTQALKLVADACPNPCTSMTLRLLAAGSTALRGVALNVPLDAAKVSLDPATFAAPFVTDAPPAARALIGTGPLKSTLVLGAARKGTGTAPAADASLSAGNEIAHFTLALVPAGGKGTVFDGAALASNAAYKAVIRSAGSASGVAVGKLEVQ